MRKNMETGDLKDQGVPLTSDELTVAVYDELRRIATMQMADERVGHTLQPTALISEAFLRLKKCEEPILWSHRGCFLVAAAQAMRRILIEHARQKGALKRGGSNRRVLVDLERIDSPQDEEMLLHLDEALNLLALHRSDVFQLIQLRYFAGLTMQEAADVLQISLRTAERNWTYGKAWLLQEMTNR